MIRAIIFDLDDTLYDCAALRDTAKKRAAKAMVDAGLPCTEEEAYKKQIEIEERDGARTNVFDKICEEFKIKGEVIVKAALGAYNSEEVGRIELFEDAPEAVKRLSGLGIKLFIVTEGSYNRQKKKIEMLGVKKIFDEIIINDIEHGTSKGECFRRLFTKYRLKPSEIISVGDRIQSEIKISNRMGMTTVRMLYGKYSRLKPKNDLEEPDFEIRKIAELAGIVERMNRELKLNIAAIGGGTGLPIVLKALKKYTDRITAIVTVTDSGRSSGILRKEYGVLPPGDTRNCLIALSESEELLQKLFLYRFENGSLNGHNFGNIFITAMTKVKGNFEQALNEVSRILKIKGAVAPSTLEDVHLCAEFSDGTIAEEEDQIVRRDERGKSTKTIKRMFMKPDNVNPNPRAISAISSADAIILSPGSLYTSIISNLLIPGIADAINASKAKKIYVANIMTQPFQTDNFKLSDHIKELEKYLHGKIDIVIANSATPDKEVLKRYEEENSFPIEVDEEAGKMATVIMAELVDEGSSEETLFKKRNLLRHDAEKLGKAIMDAMKIEEG